MDIVLEVPEIKPPVDWVISGQLGHVFSVDGRYLTTIVLANINKNRAALPSWRTKKGKNNADERRMGKSVREDAAHHRRF